jgi:hypothetical protein
MADFVERRGERVRIVRIFQEVPRLFQLRRGLPRPVFHQPDLESLGQSLTVEQAIVLGP